NPAEPGELGTNLAIGAGSDGSSKGSGSYGDVRDGSLSSYWQPSGSSDERIAIKWSSDITFNTVIIRELNGATSSWRLQDHNTGEILASGNGLGSEAIVNFDDVTTSKVNL